MITQYSNAYIGDVSINRMYQGDNLIYVSGHPDILLEYIQVGETPQQSSSSRSSAYFNTGYYPDSSTTIEVKYQLTQVPEDGDYILLGCTHTTSGGYTFSGDYYISTPGVASSVAKPVRYRNASNISIDGAIDTSTHIISTSFNGMNQTVTVDSSTATGTTSNYYKFELPIALFGRFYNTASGPNVKAAVGTRMYYLKIWDNNNLVRFYIPVLHYINGQYTPCFYDKVNNTYIYSLGTDDVVSKISGDYLLDYIQNGPDSFSAVGVSYDTGLDSSVNLYYDVILRTPDASIWSGYRTLMGTGTVSGTDTGKAYSHQALYAYNSNYAIYNGVDTIGGNNINVNGNATFPIGDKVRISLNSLNNKLYAWFSNDSSTENLGGGYQDVPAAVPNGDFLLFGERQIDNTTTSYSYGGLRFYMLNFRYVNNTPAKTFIPVFHNNQAAFLDLNSGTYIYNMGTQIPYYQFKS